MAKKTNDRASRPDDENPEWSKDDFARGRPAAEVLPEFIGKKATEELMRRGRGIGGQLFSKSFLGYTTYKMGFATREGLLPAIALMILPFLILWALIKLLPPWQREEVEA